MTSPHVVDDVHINIGSKHSCMVVEKEQETGTGVSYTML
jgi:hypothetical protein